MTALPRVTVARPHPDRMQHEYRCSACGAHAWLAKSGAFIRHCPCAVEPIEWAVRQEHAWEAVWQAARRGEDLEAFVERGERIVLRLQNQSTTYVGGGEVGDLAMALAWMRAWAQLPAVDPDARVGSLIAGLWTAMVQPDPFDIPIDRTKDVK